MLRAFNFVPAGTSIGFMKYSRPAFIGSVAAFLLSLGLFFALGLNLGIDFKGGTLIEIRTDGPANLQALRSKMSTLGLGDVELQEFGQETDVLIRIEAQPGGEEGQQNVVRRVKEALGSDGIEYRRDEVVGPKVSGELARQGTIAVVIALLAVMVYIWFRFEWQFSVGAVASLTHDVVLTLGLFAILGIEFNLSIIAAILTIVGYSLNDTVVVYDRVRENLRKFKKMTLPDLIDLSLNQMLSRTILTSVSTLCALFSLYIFGGEVIRGFTFTMIWGVIVGTYSSIFIAAPLLIFLNLNMDRSEADAAEAARP